MKIRRYILTGLLLLALGWKANTQDLEKIALENYQFLVQNVLPKAPPPLECSLPLTDNLPPEDADYWFDEARRQGQFGYRDCSRAILMKLLAAAESQKNAAFQSLVLSKLAIHFFNFEEYDSSRIYAGRSIEIAAGKEAPLEIGWAWYARVRILHWDGNFTSAFEMGNKALVIARHSKDKRLEMYTLGILGRITRDFYRDELQKSSSYFEESLQIASEIGDTCQQISMLLTIASCHAGALEKEQALRVFKKALLLLNEQPCLRQRISAVNMGGLFMEGFQKMEAARFLLEEEGKLCKQNDFPRQLQHSYIQLHELHMSNGEYQLALNYLQKADSLGRFYAYDDFTGMFGDAYMALGDFKKAADYYQQRAANMYDFEQQKKQSLITEMETAYQTREKEVELQQQAHQKWLLGIITLLLSALLGSAVWIALRMRISRRQLLEKNSLIEKQASELRQLDQLKSRFFANVSHELRTPLTLMLGPVASLLKRDYWHEKDLRLLQFVERNSKHLLKLVNEILDLSKLESKRLELKETTVKFLQFLLPMVSQFNSFGDSEAGELKFDYRAGPDLNLSLDTGKFEKIVHNFLSNALKFTPQGGRVEFIVEDEGAHLLIRVKDTGTGVHPDDLPRIFDRFYQSNQPDAPVQGGTGIGLSLCREMAGLLGGKVWAESEWGHGSTFFFQFPKKEVRQDVVGSPQSSAGIFQDAVSSSQPAVENFAPSTAGHVDGQTGESKSTILIVEDNPDLRGYLLSFLEEKYHVLTAENGKVAWELLNSKNLDSPFSTINLIISDLMMPVMDGFQLLEKIKEKDDLRHLPVIMLTARADVKVKLRALRIGVDDYLTKPFEEEELLARIKNLLKYYQERTGKQEMGIEAAHSVPRRLPTFSQENAEWLEKLEHTVISNLGSFVLTGDFLADQLALSRRQLFRRVKRFTGLTLNEYINEVRYRQARQMLEDRTYSTVKAVTYSVGMKDLAYFSRQFQERFGKLPSDYLS